MSEVRPFLQRFLRRSAEFQSADLRKQGICGSKGPQGRSAFVARSQSPISNRLKGKKLSETKPRAERPKFSPPSRFGRPLQAGSLRYSRLEVRATAPSAA